MLLKLSIFRYPYFDLNIKVAFPPHASVFFLPSRRNFGDIVLKFCIVASFHLITKLQNCLKNKNLFSFNMSKFNGFEPYLSDLTNP